jgi:UDP-glucose 4-epimerase
MRVLVVGGAGYVGSHAAHSLRDAGFVPIIYDNFSTGFRRLVRGLEVIEGDLGDRKKLVDALGNVDAVMHFAARAYVGESIYKPREYYDTNVRGGLNLLDAAMDAGVRRLVFSSSCAVYGVPDVLPIQETTCRAPINPYGATKAALEIALQNYSDAYDLRFIALRYFNAAGADEKGRSGEMHDPETHLIPCILEAAAGTRDAVTIFGDDYETHDGTCVRDYIHVNDLAAAHVSALKALVSGCPSQFINLGTGIGYSIGQVIECAERITGRSIPRRVCPRRPGDPPVLISNADRAAEVLGWFPRRGLTDMVRSAWRWLQTNEIEAEREAEDQRRGKELAMASAKGADLLFHCLADAVKLEPG